MWRGIFRCYFLSDSFINLIRHLGYCPDTGQAWTACQFETLLYQQGHSLRTNGPQFGNSPNKERRKLPTLCVSPFQNNPALVTDYVVKLPCILRQYVTVTHILTKVHNSPSICSNHYEHPATRSNIQIKNPRISQLRKIWTHSVPNLTQENLTESAQLATICRNHSTPRIPAAQTSSPLRKTEILRV